MRTDLKIGEQGYLMDNSYNAPVGRHHDKRLAGTLDTPAALVTVVSEPFTDASGDLEFILVEADGLRYMFLNRFHDDEQSMLHCKTNARQILHFP